MLIETKQTKQEGGVQILTSHGSSRPMSKEAAERIREMYNTPVKKDEDEKDIEAEK